MSTEEVAQRLQQLSARLQEMEGRFHTAEAEKAVMATELQALKAENDAAPRQAPEPRRPAPANQLVDTRLIGKPQSYDGDPTKLADWSLVMKSYMSALNPAYQDVFLNIEASQVPMRNANLDPENSALSTQLYYVLVMLCAGPALNKCYNARTGEGYETCRQFVVQWAPKLASRFVGLLMQLMSFQFDGDLVYRIGQFEWLCCDYGSQSGKRVEDDTKVGAMLLGMRDTRASRPRLQQAGNVGDYVCGGHGDLANAGVHRQHADADADRSPAVRQQGQEGQRQRQGQGKRRRQRRTDLLQLPEAQPQEERLRQAEGRPQGSKEHQEREQETPRRNGGGREQLRGSTGSSTGLLALPSLGSAAAL